jgi:hypothetical protein
MPVDTNGIEGDAHEVIKMLMSKAGYRGSVTSRMVKTCILMRFQTTKTSMKFLDYRAVARGRVERKKERELRKQVDEAQKLLRAEEERTKKIEEAEGGGGEKGKKEQRRKKRLSKSKKLRKAAGGLEEVKEEEEEEGEDGGDGKE